MELFKGTKLQNPYDGRQASDDEWKVIQMCTDEPDQRPTMEDVLKHLQEDMHKSQNDEG